MPINRPPPVSASSIWRVHPATILKQCASFVADLCEATYGRSPTLILNGDVDVTFTYIDVHLEYIATETAQKVSFFPFLCVPPPPFIPRAHAQPHSAFRATTERHAKATTLTSRHRHPHSIL